ncbi:MAG: AMP-binding protein [Pirellulales bacterium]|nr:AMP-binding protein [Pirellulales bacterium]
MVQKGENLEVNIADRVSEMARQRPDAAAVVEPLGYDRNHRRQYRSITFRQLDEDSGRMAEGLRRLGVVPGMRIALLVRPGIDFISLVIALFKARAVVVLIDPGMGRRNLIQCLAEAEPEGFIAIPLVHAVRIFLRRRFPKAKILVTVGRRWFWGGATLEELRVQDSGFGVQGSGFRIQGSEVRDQESEAKTPHSALRIPNLTPCPHPNPLPKGEGTKVDDPAAIIFTTGSTGPPKGVLFTHGNFLAQVDQIRDFYAIRPGEIDVPCFPMFGLFNCAMGVTAVIPDMDPTRPAHVDPEKILEAVRDWKATQTFGSPAVWNRVGAYCAEKGLRMETVRRVLSAGAPVPARVLRQMKDCIHAEGEIHTPYGATEALPVASIAAGEVLHETAEQTRQGAGVCVGRKFPGIQWKVIRICDGPIRSLEEIEELPPGEIGELIVHGPQVTRRYVTREEINALAKISDGENVWHRMGDSGYLDAEGRFWFCGRVAHRVLAPHGPMYTIPCEAIFNRHPGVFRTALVGVGPPGGQRPVIVVESLPGKMPNTHEKMEKFLAELRNLAQSRPQTQAIEDFLFHPAFPVDIRHNAKIFREKLREWACKQGRIGYN